MLNDYFSFACCNNGSIILALYSSNNGKSIHFIIFMQQKFKLFTVYPTTKKPAQSPTTDNIPNSSSNQPAINAPFSQDKQICKQLCKELHHVVT